jgi:hypothetical protein
MKTLLALSLTLAAFVSAQAADTTGLDDVKNAAQKLAAADNYSWTTTMESTQFRPGPSHGKTEKGGYTWVDFSMRDNKIEAIVKDGKGAVKTEDGWETLDDAAKSSDGGFNPAMFIARRMQNFKTPAVEAQTIAGDAQSLTKEDNVYSGDLTPEGAKRLMTFGGRRGGQAPAMSNAKGSVKFWMKDGVLTKYQFKLQATINRNGEDTDVERTTTVEIKDVGTTKVVVPDDAKSKLS